MADQAAHLVDHVIPHVPVRQRVLSLPFDLRALVAFKPHLRRLVLREFLRAVYSLETVHRESDCSLDCLSLGWRPCRAGAIS